MTPKAIHLFITRNAKSIFGEDWTQKVTKCQMSNCSDCDWTLMDFTGTMITMNINQDNLRTFDIVEVKGPNQIYETLRPGWTDLLHKMISDELRCECIFVFKRYNFILDEFTTNASCSECGSKIQISSTNGRKRLLVNFVKGSGEHTFHKKRRLTAARSQGLIETLMADTAHNIHSEQINSFENEIEHLPRDYISEKSLSNLKQRYVNPKPTSIDDLRQLKYDPEYADSIKEIGTDPFFVIFWTQSQNFVYSQLAKLGRLIISMDVTGGIASNNGLLKNLQITNKITLPHIFLYLICVKDHNRKSIPVAQMLSAQQDTKKICYFLERFLDEFQCPNEIVVDDSAALLKACSISFAKCSNTNVYLQKCSNLLQNADCPDPPKCYIRLDVSHFVKNLMKTKVFTGIGHQAKHFYLCCIGAILQIKSFEAIKIIVKDMLVLANCPVEGALVDGIEMPISLSRVNLQRVIRTHDVSFINETHNEQDNEPNSNEESSTEKHDDGCNSIQWYDEILNSVLYNISAIDVSPRNMTSNTAIIITCVPV